VKWTTGFGGRQSIFVKTTPCTVGEVLKGLPFHVKRNWLTAGKGATELRSRRKYHGLVGGRGRHHTLHCERSEAIRTPASVAVWIASSQGLLAMTRPVQLLEAAIALAERPGLLFAPRHRSQSNTAISGSRETAWNHLPLFHVKQRELVARMERSAIRAKVAGWESGPGLRFAPSGLRGEAVSIGRLCLRGTNHLVSRETQAME